jgi:hypothetical protein
MDWLTSLPAGVLVVGWLLVVMLFAAAGRFFVRRVVPAADHDSVLSIASPLMPALGAAFAVMIAITLSSEAGYLRSAQDVVSNEAAAASRLAWAATSPGVTTDPIHAALLEYLHSTRAAEWRGDRAAQGDPRPGRRSGLSSVWSEPRPLEAIWVRPRARSCSQHSTP